MNKLSAESIRLLSSSQVITSPSSVVKELVENAFDAGASSVDVKLEKFGLEKIEVRDNGCGIRQSDAEFMAQRYYTSKIFKHEDLQRLETYGFRGEALGSLCQVADVCIITKTTEDPVAVSYHLDHDGNVCSTKPIHGVEGTTVIALNLFKNFPVRKQCFQNTKKGKEELKKIENILIAYGLIKPEVRIVLQNNKNTMWQKNKSSDIKKALAGIFGVHVATHLEYLEYNNEDLHLNVQCFVPKYDSDPQLMLKSSDEKCFIFVNKRHVIWKELSQVLKKHCVLKNEETSSRKYPLSIVCVCLPSQDVDANLEPNKTKVIINHKEEILEIITNELCKIYRASDVPPATEKTIGTQEPVRIHSSTIIASANERVEASDASEAQDASEWKKKGSTGNEPSEPDMSERSVSAEHIARDERFNEQGNTDGLERSHSNSNTSLYLTNDFVPQEENDVINTDGDGLQSAVENNPKVNDNDNDGTYKEKETDELRKKSDVDEMLEKFMSDSDIIDDSLLDISLEMDVPNQEQWSRGQGLCDKNGMEVEPVQLLRPSMTSACNKENENSARTTSNGKRKHTCDKNNSASKSDRPDRQTKKNKKHSMISGQSLLTSALQSSKTSRNSSTLGKTKEVLFSLSRLKQLASGDRETTTKQDVQLIKRLDPWGVWLVHKNRKLFVLNPYRIQELLLYKKLLSTHVVPRGKLDKAIALNERILGGASRYSLLKELVIKNNQESSVQHCDDQRLVSNGFEITGRLDRENDEIRISLVKMNTTIPYFGVSDLVEVLDLIKNNELCPESKMKDQDLASCRSSKVCAFLKDEVTRMSQSLSSRMSDTDIAELLENMKKHLTENENTCIHDKPLLYFLASF